MSNKGFNNDFNNDFMNYQICNSDIHSPTGKYKKKHFNSLGSIILLIIGIILAVALIVGYENSVNERKARDKEYSQFYKSHTIPTTTTYDDYTVNENYNYNSYNSNYSYNRKNSNSYSDDEYNVKIYSDSDDFYEDHYDDFDGFEDADDYYEDHID